MNLESNNMRPKMIILICLFLIAVYSCNENKTANKVTAQNDSIINPTKELKGFQIWQLDYYPDSMIINRSINDNSGWGAVIAYNIKLSNDYDSSSFIGWNETWKNKVIKIDDRNFKVKDLDYQYWELKLESDSKLLMRHIYCKYGDRIKEDTGQYYPFHKVKQILTLDSLNRLFAREVLAGTYNLVFNDTFNCSKTIELDKDFKIKGIEGKTKYYIETAIDFDFPVYNSFGLYKEGENPNQKFSFKFINDTLLIKDYKVRHDKDGMFDGIVINKTRIKMIKIK